MSTILEPPRSKREAPRSKRALTLSDLADRFGPMPPWRIRMNPHPGTATEKDLLRILDHEDRLFELVDGILVEKDMGFEESELALWLAASLANFVGPRRLGRLSGADGPLRLKLGLVRIPDIAFISRARYPGGKRPRGAIAKVVPNLAVEIISRGNTPKEMRSKLQEYFKAGVELVWFVYPKSRTVESFTAPDTCRTLTETQTLTGGDVLPGFKLKLRELFSKLDEE
ncbi:MAG: Uma2 family endonuclease [Planctomycetaceae bacterium]|nr:Uma2 family endonuclease [Planctomycetaceae bacterium]